MRPIHIVNLDKARPALILTRQLALHAMTWATVAPITSRIKGLYTEVPVGPRNGLDHDCAVSLDNIHTVPRDDIGRHVGYLLPEQEDALAAAIVAAFDLDLYHG
jgi:mRNA interferase MazF